VVCREARRGLHARGAMPPAVHEALLRDVAASNGPGFALSEHQPGLAKSQFAFFPGCQLPASRPGPTRAVYEELVGRLRGGVGLMLGCCGAPAWWAGRDDESAAALEAVSEEWERLGRPTLILACPSCMRALASARPDIPLISLWEMLDRSRPGDGAGGTRSPVESLPPLAVHDPCAARRDDGGRRAIRRLLDAAGCDHRDLPRSGRLTECCGFGGLQSVAAPDIARATLAAQITADDRVYVTSCAMCRDRFAAAGKPALHLLDVLTGVASVDAAADTGPTWSERRDVRERFASEIRRDLWGDRAGGGAAGDSGLTVVFTSEARRRLDEAFVLEADIAAAVAAAEAGGTRFATRPRRAVLTAARPGSVTYWVEYMRETGGPWVHDVYCHRTEVVGVVDPASRAIEYPSVGSAVGVRCEACGVDLVPRPVRLTYLGATFDVELPACASCGAAFVPREVAVGRMREVEMTLEDK
jgi:hypothetical protein